MDSSPHVYTTGITMSKKANIIHFKNGCVVGDSFLNDSLVKIIENDNLVHSDFNVSDSLSENVDYIESIQDGFQQSEIMCGFVSDTRVESSDFSMESSSIIIESIPDSDKFPDSPGSSFPCKLEPFSSIEALVPSLDDEQLDNFLLSDFQKGNKSSSDDGAHSSEEEQRKVTEAITAIAESFGLEDLIPPSFDDKDLQSSVACGSIQNECDNIVEISLVDFDKCSDINSSLSLNERLNDESHEFELNGLDVIPEAPEILPELAQTAKLSVPEEEKIYINSKDICKFKVENNSLVLSDDKVTCELTFGNLVKKELTDRFVQPACGIVQSQSEPKETVCEDANHLVRDIPTVRITDMQSFDPSEIVNNSSAGTVLISCDKASKKMQIVLTLEQGQQVFDIETSGVDESEQVLGLDLPNVLNGNTQSIELNDVEASELEQLTAQLEAQKVLELIEDEEASFPPEFVDFTFEGPSRKRKIKTFFCPDEGCNQVFDKESKLRVHLSHKLGSRPFKCHFEGCDWAFTTPYRLRRHTDTHLGSKDYICTIDGCNRKFTTVYNLKTHVKRHKWADSLVCPSNDCQMRFSSRRRLELHLRVHEDVEAPYKCSICGKQYYSANCIASHIRTHQYNEDDFKCPFQGCGKVYDKICRLRQHIRYHTGDRPYVCPAPNCQWSFMSASKLTRHMRKHTGERKFTCTEPGCGKSFMRPEHLKGHIVIHSGDRPFHCPHDNCDAKFTAKSSLYVHLKKHCPSVQVVYPCPTPDCDKKYNTKSALKQHLQKHHAGESSANANSKKKSPSSESPVIFDLDLIDEDSLIEDPEDPSISKIGSQSSVDLAAIGAFSEICKDSEKRNKTVPKTKTRTNSDKSSAKTVKLSDKLVQQNKSGCARTDYCLNFSCRPKNVDLPMSFISFNQNSMDGNYLTNGHITTEIKSPDVMLTSSIIYHGESSDHLLKDTNFLHDDCSSNSLYHDNSILAAGSTFDTELMSASLLSDDVGSDESILNRSSSGVFSEQNSMEAFAESIHLHSLD